MTWAQDYYQRNKEELLKKRKEYAKKNPEKVRECKRRWYLANREKELARMKEHWMNNKKEYNAARRKSNQQPTQTQNEQNNPACQR
jgi:hypothetical protein